MATNNFISKAGMFFYPVRIDMLLCLIKFVFCNILLSHSIIDQLFL